VAGTAALSGATQALTRSSQQLLPTEESLSASFRRQATDLAVLTPEYLALKAAQDRLNQGSDKTRGQLLGLGSASGRLDAALLGLRTALGSTAVIGLGAGALAAIAFGKALRTAISETAAF